MSNIDCEGCLHNRNQQTPPMTYCSAGPGKPVWVVPAPQIGQCRDRLERGTPDDWADEDNE